MNYPRWWESRISNLWIMPSKCILFWLNKTKIIRNIKSIFKIQSAYPREKHAIVGVFSLILSQIIGAMFLRKLSVTLPILLIWNKFTCFEPIISIKHEEWFGLIRLLACQKRKLVFSSFRSWKNIYFGRKCGQSSKLRKLKKLPREN